MEIPEGSRAGESSAHSSLGFTARALWLLLGNTGGVCSPPTEQVSEAGGCGAQGGDGENHGLNGDGEGCGTPHLFLGVLPQQRKHQQNPPQAQREALLLSHKIFPPGPKNILVKVGERH